MAEETTGDVEQKMAELNVAPEDSDESKEAAVGEQASNGAKKKKRRRKKKGNGGGDGDQGGSKASTKASKPEPTIQEQIDWCLLQLACGYKPKGGVSKAVVTKVLSAAKPHRIKQLAVMGKAFGNVPQLMRSKPDRKHPNAKKVTIKQPKATAASENGMFFGLCRAKRHARLAAKGGVVPDNGPASMSDLVTDPSAPQTMAARMFYHKKPAETRSASSAKAGESTGTGAAAGVGTNDFESLGKERLAAPVSSFSFNFGSVSSARDGDSTKKKTSTSDAQGKGSGSGSDPVLSAKVVSDAPGSQSQPNTQTPSPNSSEKSPLRGYFSTKVKAGTNTMPSLSTSGSNGSGTTNRLTGLSFATNPSMLPTMPVKAGVVVAEQGQTTSVEAGQEGTSERGDQAPAEIAPRQERAAMAAMAATRANEPSQPKDQATPSVHVFKFGFA
eukprot:m.167183 g.167183  ORF g.167183 m.167183 type:complete len:442 (+) comp14453_c0_seq2:139-1464(+)